MIIRLYETSETTLVKQRFSAPPEIGGEFGCISLLMFTSIELRQRFGLNIGTMEVASAAELVQELGRTTEGAPEPGVPGVPEASILQLLETRPNLLPCFVARQETPTGKMLPLMSDGPEGRWSLFFGEKGALTLVEYSKGEWRVTGQEDLLPKSKRADPLAETKSFLLSSFKSARKMLARSDDGR
jgi:hypothetical protein